MFAKTQTEAEKFVSTTELPGISDTLFKFDEALNLVKGTVYTPYLSDVPDEDIKQELCSQKVKSIYKFMKTIEETPKPSGIILLTFELYNFRTKIYMRCKTCQMLGHMGKLGKKPTSLLQLWPSTAFPNRVYANKMC